MTELKKVAARSASGQPDDFAGKGVADAGPVAARIGREDAKLGDEALDPALVGREAGGGVFLAALPFAAGEPAAARRVMPRNSTCQALKAAAMRRATLIADAHAAATHADGRT